jgi:DNA modification methylase
VFDFQRVSKELHRVLNPEGGCLIWQIGAQVVKGRRSTVPEQNVIAFEQAGFHYWDNILYLKSSMPFVNVGKRYPNGYEFCQVYFKGLGTAPAVVNILNDRPQSTAGRVDDRGRVRANLGPRFNYWLVHSGKNKTTLDLLRYADGRRFSAPMPEVLCRDLLLSFTASIDQKHPSRTADVFMGANTTGKLCALNRRRFWGAEKSPRTFWEVAVPRIEGIAARAGLKLAHRSKDRVGWNYARRGTLGEAPKVLAAD